MIVFVMRDDLTSCGLEYLYTVHCAMHGNNSNVSSK